MPAYFSVFFQVLKARRWIALPVFVLVVLVTLIASLLLPKQYTADTTVALDVKAVDTVTGQQVTGYLAPSYMATQVEIIGSMAVALKVVDAMGVVNLPEAQAQFREAGKGEGDIRSWFAGRLLRGLEVRPSRESNIINLRFTGGDPKFAAATANAFAAAYVHTIADMQTAAAQKKYDFFQSQIKGLQQNLEKSQHQLSAYQQEQGIVASDERMDMETQRLNEITTQLVQAQSLAFDAQSRARGGAGASDVLNNPLIQQLKNQLATQEAKFSEIAAKNGPNHPHYLQARAELESTRNQLNQMLGQYAGGMDNAAGNSASRQASLQQALQKQKDRVLEFKSQRARLDVLQRDVDSAQRAYDSAMQRLSQTMLESRSEQTNVTVLNEATEPMRHSRPRVTLNVLLSLFVGVVLAAGCALLVEMLNRRVRSANDLQRLLGLPVLADLSLVTSKKQPRKGFFQHQPQAS
ncbi:Tyrosine-protein kinase etk [Andreprevotia sp. IGB-42]|uniref:chain length determinant protein EpsF n=1 Tax=Andreprevotia sp. IGB-42 TaxID=2497473 RepID=UPI00135C4091|nr:chain length determinant protein EpsF [Andreprevotia sp. IGB-42]KAF0815386.1 Tyrosine-protein kinase etk [Andreprevotia sp. IGB-42]